MFRSKERFFAVLAVVVLLTSALAVASLPASANGLNCSGSTKIWDGGGGSSDVAWGTAANWDPDGTPSPSDTTCIPASAQAHVQADATAASLKILPDAMLIIGNDMTLTITGSIASEGDLNSFGMLHVGGSLVHSVGYLGLRNDSSADSGTTVTSGTVTLGGAIEGNVSISNASVDLMEMSTDDVTIDGNVSLSNSSIEFSVFRFTSLAKDTLSVTGDFLLATSTAKVDFNSGNATLATNPLTFVSWTGTSPMEDFTDVDYITPPDDYTFTETYTSQKFRVHPANSNVVNPPQPPSDGEGETPEPEPAPVPTPPTPGISAPVKVADDGTVTTVPVAPTPQPAVAIASTSSGNGSWSVTPDGGVFAAGDAAFKGSMGGNVLNAPMVGIVPTVTGNGYYLVADDGGVFSFGDAAFKGSMGGKRLNAPVTSIASTCTNNGYYLVADDGGVFAFGDAQFLGSMGGTSLNQKMAGIVPACDNGSYWTFAHDGGVFTFGNAQFHGSLASNPPPGGVIGMIAAPDGMGYWLIGADKKAYGFGSVA